MASILERRFEELTKQGNEIIQKKTVGTTGLYAGVEILPEDDVINWGKKAYQLLLQVAGRDSHYPKSFLEWMEPSRRMAAAYRFSKALPIFYAAHEDYTSGMFQSPRNLVQAEVFSTELEQAAELLDAGYVAAAAVAAGIVLETTVRQLCDANKIPNDRKTKLDKMNADLAKAGVYNVLVQKRITHLTDLRNKAAHGDNSAYTEADVRSMIPDVERFVAEHLP